MDRVKIKVDFLLNASPSLLYRFFTSPSDIIRWFCDKADVAGDVYTFEWNGYEEEAKLTEDIEEELVRFDWLDEDRDGEYLEFAISTSGMTGETILEITDFCDRDEIDEQKALWTTQIDQLRKGAGLS